VLGLVVVGAAVEVVVGFSVVVVGFSVVVVVVVVVEELVVVSAFWATAEATRKRTNKADFIVHKRLLEIESLM
jgi:hypothetical protein